jgi:hypothetical protein
MEFVLMILLAAFALGLGFFALLKQKTYLDAASGTVTAVEVPLVGKLQTNYPALVFVFIGAVFGYFAYDAATTTRPFIVDGQLKSNEQVANWSATEITVIPSTIVNQQVNPNGRYRIDLQIPKSESFDRWVESINFQNGQLSGRISPNGANDTSKANKKSESLLDADVEMKLVK